MSRLANVHLRAYRGLQDVEMKGLQDINVLIGPTNTGKSSMLEAIWLATGSDRLAASLEAIVRGRGIDGASSILALFPRLQPERLIEIGLGVHSKRKEEQELVLNAGPCEASYASFPTEIVHGGNAVDKCRFIEATWNYTQHHYKEQVAVREEDLRVFGSNTRWGTNFSAIGSCAWILPHDLLSLRSFDTSYSETYVSDSFPVDRITRDIAS